MKALAVAMHTHFKLDLALSILLRMLGYRVFVQVDENRPVKFC